MQLASPLTIDDFERLPDELAVNHELEDGKFDDREAILKQNDPFQSDLIPGFSIRLGNLFDQL